MNLRSLVRASALVTAMLLPVASFAQTQPASTPVRIANLGFTEASALPIYADKEGIFKKYGIDATISTFNGGGAVVAAIAGGSLEAGFSNITSALQAIEKGIPIVILFPANLTVAGKADALLVKARGSKIKTGADLNGKTVATTTLGGTLQLAANTWIDKNGGDSKTVHFVELATSNMAAALKAGRVDAAMLSEPFLTEQKSDVEPLADAFAAISPQWISGAFVASKAWVSANPDAARRFVAAMKETARWANAHHEDTAKILSPLSGVPLATFEHMERSTYTDQMTKALLQPGVDTAVRYGALPQPYDMGNVVTAAAPYWK